MMEIRDVKTITVVEMHCLRIKKRKQLILINGSIIVYIL